MKPNILFIMTDQHMVKTIGAYGSEICQTPNIDKLAEEGILFTNAYTTCPICTPARASVQTGVFPFKHGMMTNVYTKGAIVHELADNPQLLSRRLQGLGYQIGFTGKWHLGAGRDASFLGGVEYPELVEYQTNSGLPSDVGYYGDDFPGHGGIGEDYESFHAYLKEKGITYEKKVYCDTYPKAAEILSSPEGTVPHFLTDNAMKHMDHFLEESQPFFYMLNHWQPHEPYHVPTKYLDMYRNVDIPPWESFDEDITNQPFIHNVQRGNPDSPWESTQEFVRYYFAAVTQVDDQVGRIVQYLKERGLYENTIIIFSADHGETLGIHNGLSDKGLNMYEETCNIPLIIKGIEGFGRPGETEDRLVSLVDFYSTILEIAGEEREKTELHGLSLVPLIANEPIDWREWVVAESSGIDNIAYTQRMIRYKNIKFVFHSGDMDELYLLDEDPHELNNLATNPAYFELAAQMRVMLRKWMVENGDGFIIRYDQLAQAKNHRYSR